jgi:alpha-glucosidase (family GH31 glycosyl hydrolase)
MVAAVLVTAGSAAARSPVVRAGRAWFEVLTPTLIRMQYAQDEHFDTTPTLTTGVHVLPAVRDFSSRVAGGWLVIDTGQVTLRYRIGSGSFNVDNVQLSIRIAGRRVTVHPVAGSSAGNLGGWTRALDNQDGPVPLHDGVLSTAGWYVLDDTDTVLLTGGAPGYAVRPARVGPYQDWYLFAYGHDYVQGLADLRALTGPAPLLPRSAFGVWFSRYYPYSESDYHTLLAQFRAYRVPIDTLSIDTDFKREDNPVGSAAAAIVAGAPGLPYSWNGWEWDTTLFPDPQRFIDWAHSQGLSLAINIHPTIDTRDPRYPAAAAQAGPLTPDSGECTILQADPLGTCMTFDWTNARQLAAYFALQRPFAQQGIDLFWLDWCCDGPQPAVPGLTEDTWINSQYAAEQHARGSRWPAFSRIGGAFTENGADGPDNDRAETDSGDGALAEHRYTIQFTGDTCATWQMLAFEAQLSAVEGNIGLPYVSDDIGSYNGVPGDLPCGESDYQVTPTAQASRELPDDMYARWVQFGTFQPLDRLHSNHGNRLPWEYGAAADQSATAFLDLREELNPYIYTLARRSYDTGLPITGSLYLQWPQQAGAYSHPSEYTFGPNMVVEPVTASGDPAPASVWIPPGEWLDYFTGERYRGPSTVTLSVPLSQMPVLVRAGTVIPTQPYAPFTPPGPNPSLTLTVYPGTRGGFTLYDDQGVGFGYQHREYTLTPITHTQRERRSTVTIGATTGAFPDKLRARAWQVELLDVMRPRDVTLEFGHHTLRLTSRGTLRTWAYNPATHTLTINTGPLTTSHTATISTR